MAVHLQYMTVLQRLAQHRGLRVHLNTNGVRELRGRTGLLRFGPLNYQESSQRSAYKFHLANVVRNLALVVSDSLRDHGNDQAKPANALLATPQFLAPLIRADDCGDIQVPQVLAGSKVSVTHHLVKLKLLLPQNLNHVVDASHVLRQDDLLDLKPDAL